MINFIPNNFNLGLPIPEYTQPGGDTPISAKSGFNFNNNFLNPFSYNPLINSSDALNQLGGLFGNPSANQAVMGNQSMSNVFAPGISYSPNMPGGYNMFGSIAPQNPTLPTPQVNPGMPQVVSPERDLAQISGRNPRLMDDFGFRNRMTYDPI